MSDKWIVVIAVFVLGPFQAVTFLVGWRLFAEPLGAPQLGGFWVAYGVLTLLRFATFTVVLPEKIESSGMSLLFGFLVTLMALAMFGIAHVLR